MGYVPPEVVSEVKKLDLFTYLKIYEPNELIHESGDTYCTREHDSLKISNGMWNWFSHKIGGRSALDYLIVVRDLKFVDAVIFLQEKMGINANIIDTLPDVKYENKVIEKEMILPPKNDNCRRVFAYLSSRCIDKEIINYCIDNNLIYEDLPNHNVVFLGYDEKNVAKFGCVRATNSSRFMHDLKGSSKQYSFRLLSKTPATSLHIFESAIDLLSYATILKSYGLDFRNYSLMSLSGVYQTAQKIEDSKLPVVLENYLKSNDINKIILHLDNDRAGRDATKALEYILKNDYIVEDKPASYGKDINDYLCHITEQKKIRNSEKGR